MWKMTDQDVAFRVTEVQLHTCQNCLCGGMTTAEEISRFSVLGLVIECKNLMFARSPVSQSETTCDHCSAPMTQHLKIGRPWTVGVSTGKSVMHSCGQLGDRCRKLPTRGHQTPNSWTPTALSQRAGCQSKGHSPAPRRREASTSRFHRAHVVSLTHDLRSCVLHRTVRRSSCGLEVTQKGSHSSKLLHSCDIVT